MSVEEMQLKRIQEKVQQLLKEYVVVQKENKKLKEELDTARERALTQQKSTDEFKQQVSVLKLSAGEMNETDKKEFEKRINGYLKEIDRCISLLDK